MCKCIYRPNTGQQVKQETLGELKKKYKKVTFESFGVQNPPRLGLFKMLFCIRWLLRSVRSTGRSSLTAVPRLAATPFGRWEQTIAGVFADDEQCHATCSRTFLENAALMLTWIHADASVGFSGQLQEQDGRNGMRGWAQAENLQCPHRFAWQPSILFLLLWHRTF